MSLSQPLRLVLAEDHTIMREGLKLLLSQVEDVEIIGEAADGAGVLAALANHPVDLLVLDLGMPGISGLSYVRDLRVAWPRLKILILSANVEARTVRAAIDAGADGYVTKTEDPAELIAAIEALRQGRCHLGPALRGAQADTALPDPAPVAMSPVPLTRRERQVLGLVAHGTTARLIGERLGISPLTVRKHRENLMRKLDLHNTAELTAYAVRLGLPAG